MAGDTQLICLSDEFRQAISDVINQAPDLQDPLNLLEKMTDIDPSFIPTKAYQNLAGILARLSKKYSGPNGCRKFLTFGVEDRDNLAGAIETLLMLDHSAHPLVLDEKTRSLLISRMTETLITSIGHFHEMDGNKRVEEAKPATIAYKP